MPDAECAKLVHPECGGLCIESEGHSWPCTPQHNHGCSVLKNVRLKLAMLPILLPLLMEEPDARQSDE